MKILYLTLENLSLHKGSVVHIKEIVAGLRNLGHQMGLVASSFNKYEKCDKFYNLHQTPISLLKLFRLRRQPYILSSIFLFLYLFKILPQYEIIYARDYHTVIVAFLPRLIFYKKLVFEINGIANEERMLKGNSIINSLLAFLTKVVEKVAMKCCNRIISVTPQIASYLIKYFHCSLEKVEIVSNGVNTKKFRPIHDKALLLDWQEKLGIVKGEIVIAFVGNLAPWQGVEYLIRVAPLIVEEIKNIKFLIVGDGILGNELKSEVKRLGLLRYFVFTGMVDYEEIPLYINIADVCVLLKQRLKSGYSPIKLYEYMACGKPIVASRVEGLEFIEMEEIGLLIEPGDLIGLEKALRFLIMNPKERINMGRKGLQIAHEKFDWGLKVSKIEEILSKLA